MSAPLLAGIEVHHPQFGRGRVDMPLPDGTVYVRFDNAIQRCLAADLQLIANAEAPNNAAVGIVALRLLAHAIQSCNDSWGVFSPSTIDLLPHQLWVCHQVVAHCPARWLIAEDVGMGKTVEAGLILWSLIAAKKVKRLLIIAPASIVEQWEFRLRQMFDLRVQRYTAEQDTPKADFWGGEKKFVAASLHTLRMDNNARQKRLLDAPRWDLVVVDEAHHLNKNEFGDISLNYHLLAQLGDRADSLLFFTGTPHRGKNFNFLALLQLLRPDLFDPKKSFQSQLPHFGEVMIRSNKQTVTDLQGKRLFSEPRVASRTYQYSPAEQEFYDRMTAFILSGRAYADKLSGRDGRAVNLVLTILQKLAASSLAAIRHALIRRREKLRDDQARYETYLDHIGRGDYDEADAENARDEAELAQRKVRLCQNESAALDELIDLAASVETETKIAEIMRYTRELPAGDSVLFFTEYKATQKMLLVELTREYGENAVTFINGDGFLDEVATADGRETRRTQDRETAAEAFNRGEKRFLISTEAAGEGIDLQEHCHRLVHIDIPWNPMRLHQRLGRINRYGQTRQVEVALFYNPSTLDGQIWQLLTDKITRINAAMQASMDEPEDLFPLVLGMTPAAAFDDLYTEALRGVRRDGLKSWFDQKTRAFGGKDIVESVRSIVGKVQRFNYQDASAQIPHLDLPDLQPFFTLALRWRRRQIRRGDRETIAFKTPEEWAGAAGVEAAYDNLLFQRRRPQNSREWRVVGVGSPVFNAALADAQAQPATVGILPPECGFTGEVFVFEAQDTLTGGETGINKIVCGARRGANGIFSFLRDGDLIALINSWLKHFTTEQFETATDRAGALTDLAAAKQFACDNLDKLSHPFRMPELHFLGMVKGE